MKDGYRDFISKRQNALTMVLGVGFLLLAISYVRLYMFYEGNATMVTAQDKNKNMVEWVMATLKSDSPVKPTFVEFGCADGITNSNSYVFEKKHGWTGLCIEPSLHNCDLIKERRTHGICGLITPQPETFTYADMKGNDCGQLSGIIEFYSPRYKELLKECEDKGVVTKRTVKGIPLQTLLDDHNMPNVSWISVDCEGCEAAFIGSFDFTKYDVRVLNYEENTAARMHRIQILADLSKHGFVEISGDFQDRVFYRPKVLHSSQK